MKIAIIIFSLLLCCSAIFSQSLKVKTSFGNNGNLSSNLANDATTVNNACALQPDGKILLGGTGLIRILPNGGLDSSFGISGAAFSDNYPEVRALALQADGKILCGLNNNDAIQCRRINSNGSIDSSFGLNGIASITQFNSFIYCINIRLQADGKLLVTGSMDSVGSTRFFIARLLTDGSLDNSFNGNGKLNLQLSTGAGYASDAAFQSDGKIIITGNYKQYDSLGNRLAVIRLFNNGTRDMSFNGTGIYDYISPTISAGEFGQCLYIYPDNSILVAGGTNAKLLLTKLLTDGKRDSSFNNIGIVITEIGEFNSPTNIHIRPDGKILITGATAFYLSENSWDYAAFQFYASGQPDNSFSSDGKISFPLPQNEHSGGSVLLPDGKIVFSGFRDAIPIMNTVKFNANGNPDNTYGTNAINYLYVRGTDDQVKKIIIQPDGKIIAAGQKSVGVNNKGSIAFTRYSANGNLDSSFGTNGIFLFDEPGIYINSSVLQMDGKILVSGSKYGDAPDYLNSLAVFRLNANGTRDNSFAVAGNGLLLLDSALAWGIGTNIALQSNGKIMIACNYTDEEKRLMIFRLNANGTLDNSFGINGRRLLAADTSVNYLSSMGVLSDNKILLAGNKVLQDSLIQFFIMRLLPDGSIDGTFGNNGLNTSTPSATAFTNLTSLAVTVDGKIFLGGHIYESDPAESEYPYVARFNANGTTDSSFNSSGHIICYNNFGNSTSAQCNSIAIHPDSSLYLTGIFYDTTFKQQRFIIRLKNNGTIDSTISADGSGWLLTNNKVRFNSAYDIKITSDSTILVGEGVVNLKENLDLSISAYKRLSSNQGRLYIFNGNGNWNNPANWSYEIIPPSTLPDGSVIIVAPGNGSSCILNGIQNLGAGSSITIKTGANFIINGNLLIAQ